MQHKNNVTPNKKQGHNIERHTFRYEILFFHRRYSKEILAFI